MNQTITLKMPNGTRMDTIFISTETELTPQLLEFWTSTRGNPIVGFDTEWGCNTDSRDPNSNKARITLLKLCNVSNTCLLINLSALDIIPQVLIKFLAVRDIRFVGINIAKELQKLKEDYGLEIRNAIELTTIAAEKWDEIVVDTDKSKVYEHWDSYRLRTPCKKYDIPLGGFRLLYLAFLEKQLSTNLPASLVSEEDEKVVHYKYLTLPVFAALEIGFQLLTT